MIDFNVIVANVLLDCTKEQLDSLVEAIKHRRNSLAITNKAKISAGMDVEFKYKGIDYAGVVKNVKLKKAVVYSYANRAKNEENIKLMFLHHGTF